MINGARRCWLWISGLRFRRAAVCPVPCPGSRSLASTRLRCRKSQSGVSPAGHLWGNLARFHAADGAGYVFLGEWIARLDAINASMAAYLAKSFEPWRKYDAPHQAKCRQVLEGLRAKPGLSQNVLEVMTRLLG